MPLPLDAAAPPADRRPPDRRAAVRHGANVLRALGDNLGADVPGGRLAPPLDHPSAQEALTLLNWRGETPAGVLAEALELSQPACVRLIDRVEAAGLVARHTRPRDRRVWVAPTPAGLAAAAEILAARADAVEDLLAAAFPDPDDLDRFVAGLDVLARTAFGDQEATHRFCRGCDVAACFAGGRTCPSAEACRSNLEGRS